MPVCRDRKVRKKKPPHGTRQARFGGEEEDRGYFVCVAVEADTRRTGGEGSGEMGAF